MTRLRKNEILEKTWSASFIEHEPKVYVYLGGSGIRKREKARREAAKGNGDGLNLTSTVS